MASGVLAGADPKSPAVIHIIPSHEVCSWLFCLGSNRDGVCIIVGGRETKTGILVRIVATTKLEAPDP